MVTQEQAEQALQTLIEYGKQSFKPEYRIRIHEGQFCGQAISNLKFDPIFVRELAGEAFEDMNWHEDAATVRKMPSE